MFFFFTQLDSTYFQLFYYMWIEQQQKINENFRTVAMFLYLIPHQVSPVTQDVSYFDVYFRIYT